MSAPPVAKIQVEVVLAWAGHDWRRTLTLDSPLDSPVPAAEALKQSGMAGQFEGLDPWRHGVAVFGRRILPEQLLRAGVRLEILRPLEFDPMESRRRRAEHRRRKAVGTAASKGK